MVIAPGSVMSDPSSGPMMRIVNHHAAGVPRPRFATRRSDDSAKVDDRTRRGERHDHHHEQRFRVVDRVVQIVLRRVPAFVERNRRAEHHGPQSKHHFDFPEEVQQPGGDAGRRRTSEARVARILRVLDAVRERGEPRRRERVQQREREDARGDRVERILLDARRERADDPAVVNRRVGRQRSRELGDGVRGLHHPGHVIIGHDVLTTLCLLLSFAAGQDSIGVVYQTAPEVSRHEPVVTTLVVENRTQEEIRFDLGFDRTEHVVAVVKKPDGNAWPLSLRTIGDGVRRRGRISIEPGGRYVQRFVLDRWIDFDQIGDYELEIQANVAVTTKSGALVSRAISGTTRTRITPRNEQRLREVGRTLAETALSGRAEDGIAAAQALQYLVDEVAVPHVARILLGDGLGTIP